MKPIVSLIAVLAISNVLFAQDDGPPLLMPEERQAVDEQSAEFSEAITPALAEASKSTVRVWAGARRVAYGTVVGDGTKILSKWSEVARGSGELKVDVAGAEYRKVKTSGVYPKEDLVVLEIEGPPLKPVRWSNEVPKLGSFLAAPQPDGRLAAFGVVSVLERNLKDTDLAYLGVFGEPGFTGQGVKIARVAEDSGAFKAGLEAGNVILKVGERPISGLLALKNALSGVAPGTTVPLLVESKGAAKTVKVLLGNRPQLPQFSGDRLQQMERMGGPISKVRNGFARALQTDMRFRNVNQIGGPVVDLKGRAVGITIARADRTRSFVMPAAAVVSLLKSEAKDPSLAEVRGDEDEELVAAVGSRQRRVPVPPPGMSPQQEDGEDGGNRRSNPAPGMSRDERLHRHLSDMQRLMYHLQDEMDALGEP